MACVRVPRSRGPAAALLPTLEQWRGMLGCLGRDGWCRAGGWGSNSGARKAGERRGSGSSLGRLGSPKALGQRSASGTCAVGKGGCWPWGGDARWGRGLVFLWGGQSPLAARHLPQHRHGGCSGWAEGRHGGDPLPGKCLCPIWLPRDQVPGVLGAPLLLPLACRP